MKKDREKEKAKGWQCKNIPNYVKVTAMHMNNKFHDF